MDGVTYYSDTSSVKFTLQTVNGCCNLDLTINYSTTRIDTKLHVIVTPG